MSTGLTMLRSSISNSLSGGLNIADVFSVDLYTGNGTTQSINVGFDLSTEGGMTWSKARDVTLGHYLLDTERGNFKTLSSNTDVLESTFPSSSLQFNTTGFTVGNNAFFNTSARPYVNWTFRKAPNFFDVITYTGNAVIGRQISHNLGIQAGMVVVKQISQDRSWYVQHISRGGLKYLNLDLTAAEASSSLAWNNTSMTDTNVTLGNNSRTNASTQTYVMYAFAHDPSPKGVIQCGEYTGTGVANTPEITLGWRPQYVMIKKAEAGTEVADWFVMDTTRGITAGNDPYLKPNLDAEEDGVGAADIVDLTATGFTISATGKGTNESGVKYIYMAIREE